MPFPLAACRPKCLPPPWLLKDLPGYAVEYDVSRLTGLADNDLITSLTDYGSGYHATAAGDARATYKTDIVNHQPVARFAGAQEMATAGVTSPAIAQPFTVFIVTKYASGACFFANHTSLGSLIYRYSATMWGTYAGTAWLLAPKPDESAFHVVTALFNGAASYIAFDGNCAIVGNPGSDALAGIRLGNYSGGAAQLSGDIAHVCVCSGALAKADAHNAEALLGSKYARTINSVASLLFEGDSIAAGYLLGDPVTDGYPYKLGAAWAVKCRWYNNAGVGRTLGDMNIESTDHLDPFVLSGWKNVLVLLGGTNNLSAPDSLETTKTAMTTYLTNRKAAGHNKIFVLTVTPRQDAGIRAGFEADRVAFNTWLKATNFSTSTATVVIVDIAADSRLDDPTDTGYYNADKLHINAAGHTVIKDLCLAALNAGI